MSNSYGESTPSSGAEVVLTPENEAMSKSLLGGLARALHSDFVDIYEVVDTGYPDEIPKLPDERYLAKVVFMKLALADIDSESLTSSNPDFQVAVMARVNGLSVEDIFARKYPDEESTQFVWPDSAGAYLLDNEFNNVSEWAFTFQPGLGGKFSFRVSTRGFIRSNESDGGIIESAFDIDTNIRHEGVYITKGGLTSIGQLRTLEATLKKGRLDRESSERLRTYSEKSSDLNWLSDNVEVVRGSAPYFKKLSEAALQLTPEYRSMIAQEQYWDKLTR